MKKQILKERIEFLEAHIGRLEVVIQGRDDTIADLEAQPLRPNFVVDWTSWPYGLPYWVGQASTQSTEEIVQETTITFECNS